jgi:4-amino-4-deoxy-L-arabinose transferase-like glycosyltransferase
MKHIKRAYSGLADNWQPLALYGGLLILFGGLLWYDLAALTAGYSAGEQATFKAGTGLRTIFDSPVNAPFLLLERVGIALGQDSLILTRAVAVLFGLLTITAFYWLLRYWHGERTALIGTIIFGTSAWFLHTARLGTPDVLLFGLLGLAAVAIWLKKSTQPWKILLMAAVLAALLYVPGMIWFAVFGAVWHWRTLGRACRQHLVTTAIAAAGLAVALAPLGWAIYKTPETAKVIAGLPREGWPNLIDSLQRFISVPIELFVRGPNDPEHWLARLPVLAAFSAAMLLLGIFLYVRHWRLPRSKMLFAILGLGTILIALGGEVSLSIIIPAVYTAVAAGIGLLLDRWFVVFPRNAIAQGVGLGLVIVVISGTCFYNLRRYFVAWPNAPATKSVFVIKSDR